VAALAIMSSACACTGFCRAAAATSAPNSAVPAAVPPGLSTRSMMPRIFGSAAAWRIARRVRTVDVPPEKEESPLVIGPTREIVAMPSAVFR
jgi:hypothetical protein